MRLLYLRIAGAGMLLNAAEVCGIGYANIYTMSHALQSQNYKDLHSPFSAGLHSAYSYPGTRIITIISVLIRHRHATSVESGVETRSK